MSGSFEHVFDKSIHIYSKQIEDDEVLFNSFRNREELFAFIHNGDSPPDHEAISIAKNININLYNSYLKFEKKLLGYDGGPMHENANYDNLDSRHIMMSIIAFGSIPNGEQIDKIIEIGGGFGNWLCINYFTQKFGKWKIIDMPHMCKLQNWVLEKYSIPKNIYENISSLEYLSESSDLVIGSHSLSEFSWDVFIEYYSKIIVKSKFFFYAYHRYSPSTELVSKKRQLIDLSFDIITCVSSEGGNVYNCLFKNKNLLDVKPVDKQIEEITLCITSCNRAFLLDKTLESFVKYNTYPIKETYIIDDSGNVGCNDEVIAKYKDILNIKPIYNEKNIGQIESIDKMYSYVTTPWIFHCEEDWEFLQAGFIEKSMKIFNDNPDDRIFTVSLRPHNDTSGHPIEYDSLNRGYYEMSRYFSFMWENMEIVWGGPSLNPGLRRTSTCLKYHPYSEKCGKLYRNGAYHADEYMINEKYRLDGYYSCILDDPAGHVKHIGYGHHVHREGFD